MKKLISILMIIIILITFCSSVVFADTDPITAMGGAPTADNGFFTTVAGKVLNIVQIIGAVAATIMIVMIAIKFMTASPTEKADVKKQLIGYVIGVVILVAMIGLIQMVAAFGGQVSSTAGG
ncbi:MAG: hypothetical protein FWF46_02770 [Oscillospiraceae bacterium]|nr:hypothetical protein [Oscillospiraceae bacterium]